jgi:hypothetical protein
VILAYSWRSLRELLREPDFPAMLYAHWLEGEPHKEACPYSPMVQRYVDLDDAGGYAVWVAQDGELIAGYIGMFVQPHMHSGVVTATGDLFHMLPAYRGHYYPMLKACVPALRERGVVRWFMGDRPAGSLAAVYHRLGFVDIEHTYAKLLT